MEDTYVRSNFSPYPLFFLSYQFYFSCAVAIELSQETKDWGLSAWAVPLLIREIKVYFDTYSCICYLSQVRNPGRCPRDLKSFLQHAGVMFNFFCFTVCFTLRFTFCESSEKLSYKLGYRDACHMAAVSTELHVGHVSFLSSRLVYVRPYWFV